MQLTLTKFSLIGAVVLLAAMLIPLMAQAEEGSGYDRREDARDRMEDRRDGMSTTGPKDRLEDVRDRAEDIREQGRENAVDRIKLHLKRYVLILESAINRMEKL